MATPSAPQPALHAGGYPAAELVGGCLSLHFFIPGRPVPKGRPRSRVSGIKQLVPGKWVGKPFVQVYTDRATVDWEAHIAASVQDQLRQLGDAVPAGRLPLDGRLLVTTRFLFPRPQKPKAPYPMGRRDDFDNLVKLVLDALQPSTSWGGLIVNDGNVTDSSICKRYADTEDQVGTYLEVVSLA